MLCPELPGGVLWTGTEDADGIAPEGCVELVHGSSGQFPPFVVQLAPQGRLPNGLGHQLRNLDAALE